MRKKDKQILTALGLIGLFGTGFGLEYYRRQKKLATHLPQIEPRPKVNLQAPQAPQASQEPQAYKNILAENPGSIKTRDEYANLSSNEQDKFIKMNYSLINRLISLASPFRYIVSTLNKQKLDDIIEVVNYLQNISPDNFYISKTLRDKINYDIEQVSSRLPRLFGTRRRKSGRKSGRKSHRIKRRSRH